MLLKKNAVLFIVNNEYHLLIKKSQSLNNKSRFFTAQPSHRS